MHDCIDIAVVVVVAAAAEAMAVRIKGRPNREPPIETTLLKHVLSLSLSLCLRITRMRLQQLGDGVYPLDQRSCDFSIHNNAW